MACGFLKTLLEPISVQRLCLKFETASNLGNDSSGNDNDWTVSNMPADHQTIQSPTHGN